MLKTSPANSSSKNDLESTFAASMDPLVRFLESLRAHRVPVSVREWLDLHAILRTHPTPGDRDVFYVLARIALVKDERHYDRFDQAFMEFLAGLGPATDSADAESDETGGAQPADLPRYLDESGDSRSVAAEEDPAEGEEMACGGAAEGAGSEGEPGTGEAGEEGEGGASGEKGEAGESGEEGDGGESGERGEDGEEGEGEGGLRGIGWSEKGESGVRDRAVGESRKLATAVWLERRFEDYDERVELGTRTFRMALRRLRRFAREAEDLELDLPGTISQTARQGWLDIRMVPERRNAIRVLLLLDVGGSMDSYIEETRQLFVAASSEFRHLETFYFHNCVYQSVWQSNERGNEERTLLRDVFRRFGSHYKVVIVGDAHMRPAELTEVGGSVERYNAETGEVWMSRLTAHFRRVVWLNPEPQNYWADVESCRRIADLVDGEMYPLSAEGITGAMRSLLR